MAFQFRIQLKNIKKPPVWRQIVIPENLTFEQFHLVIQEAFGWRNYHLYQFSPSGYGSVPVIANPSEDKWEKPGMNASRTKLSFIFNAEGQKYTYIYDFSDDWIHNITLEKIIPGKALKAVCLAGKGACPPEDCGGPFRYEHLKEILKDPAHKDYNSMIDWLGMENLKDNFDSEKFDLKKVNSSLLEI